MKELACGHETSRATLADNHAYCPDCRTYKLVTYEPWKVAYDGQGGVVGKKVLTTSP